MYLIFPPYFDYQLWLSQCVIIILLYNIMTTNQVIWIKFNSDICTWFLNVDLNALLRSLLHGEQYFDKTEKMAWKLNWGHNQKVVGLNLIQNVIWYGVKSMPG